ncbi:MAG: hypothetical protein HQL30_12210 [Candidatus Omnitrophica bacterium]|nr:hypothetical protein [Candidatus Omnitrophota bacterium]
MELSKDFNKRFGIIIDSAECQSKFVHRIDVMIGYIANIFRTDDFLDYISIEWGERYDLKYSDQYVNGPRTIKSNFLVSQIHQGKFTTCLRLVELLFAYCRNRKDITVLEHIDAIVKDAIEISEVDIGIRWHDGKFYPAGARELDERLVEDVLDWLNDYPKEKKDYFSAIKALVEKRYDDIPKSCYTCVEGIAKKLLKNGKNLDANKEELVSELGLSSEWKSLVGTYLKYTHENGGRHSSEKRHKLSLSEIEAFLYMTGLIIRLAINTIREKR